MGRGYDARGLSDACAGGSRPPYGVDIAPSEGELSRARSPGPSCALHRPALAELDPREVSSASSDFSESSSRNEDVKMPAVNEPGARIVTTVFLGSLSVSTATQLNRNEAEHVVQESGKAKEISPANTSTTVPRDGLGPGPMSTNVPSHVKGLIGMPPPYIVSCTHMVLCHTIFTAPLWYAVVSPPGRFQVWIVISKERLDLPTIYGRTERRRIAKEVLARLLNGSSGQG